MWRALKKTFRLIRDIITLATLTYAFASLVKMPIDMWREHFEMKRIRQETSEQDAA